MIKDIIGSNFLSYQDQFHLHISQGQLNVVIGRSTSDYADSNGTGKTSLLKALLWGLYGKFPGMEDADSVVNTKAKKNTEVRVHFEKNGTAYVVQRYRKHKEYKNEVFCWEGTHQHAGDNKTVQAKIVEVIGMDYDVFLSTLVFTGEREDEFAGGTDKEQKQVLNALLPLHFEKAYDHAAMEVAKATKAVETATTRIAVLEGQLPQFDTQTQQAQQQAQQWQTNHAANIRSTQEAITSVQDQLKGVEEQLAGFEQNEAQWQRVFSEIRNGSPALTTEREDLFKAKRTKDSELQAHLNALTRQGDIRQVVAREQEQVTARQNDLNQQIKALTSATAQTCPTCGQTVQGDALQRTLDALQQQVTASQEAFQKFHWEKAGEIEQLNDSVLVEPEAKQQEIDDVNKRLAEIDAIFQGMAAEEAKHQQAYAQHKTAHDSLRTQTENKRRDLAVNQKHLSDLQTQTVNPYTGQVQQIAEQRKKAEEELTGTRQARADAEVGVRRWTAVKTMFSGGKGGLHHFVFEQVLPEMTAMSQMFLNFFSANTLKVGFESHKKKGKKTIEGFFVKAERGSVSGFGNLSRGEQRRINVAISLTLFLMASKHVFNPGILFLDEVADSLDQTGKQSIIELLEHFCSQYDTAAVLLTNERELIAHVHSGYECVMADGVSTLAPISES